MRARKKTGRPALATPTTALSTTSVKTKFTGNAANDQAAADVFVGTVMRALRRFAELRLQDARQAQCLAQLAKATDALSSATWAIEYEAALRDRGER
jgi:hypothetical protein